MLGRFTPVNLAPQPGIPGYADLIDKLRKHDQARFAFLRVCLRKLGLEVNSNSSGSDVGGVGGHATLPKLSTIHLSASDSSRVSELLCAWGPVIERENGEEHIRGGTDVFQILTDEDDGLVMADLRPSLPTETDDLQQQGQQQLGETGLIDYAAVTKTLVAHEKALPSTDVTPRFNHKLYYASLERFQRLENGAEDWGNVLMYGDVVTSTNSLLEGYVVAPLPLIVFSFLLPSLLRPAFPSALLPCFQAPPVHGVEPSAC